ncbi:MAG: long-chain fatty acid--CoA ligase [Crocinitomicaceae bacterium]|nr:long-chain fatty acid--CoA ligase [Crocinitomicaceae bacterium]
MDHVKRLFDIPYYQLEKYPQPDCFVDKREGRWVKTSTEEYLKQANLISQGLIELGVQHGDKIGLISTNNRSEWHIMDIGVQQVGAISVPVYPTISENDYRYIFNDAQIKLCFVSDQELFRKVNAVKNEVSSLQEIYSFEEVDGCKNWEEVKDLGDEKHSDEVNKRKAAIKEEDLVTLIYTSGTTGNPKGVMLSHLNLVSNAKACVPRLPVDENARSLSFLPICHVYERMLIYLYQMTGVSVYFAESIDTIGDNLKEVKPEVFTAVPRLLEKVYDKIIAKGEELSGVKRKLFFWAVSLGEQYTIPEKGGFYKFKLKIARKLIFSKWQEALGGRCKAVASGSAALSPRLARIYLAAGIPVMEGYGLTETSPVISVNCQKGDGVRIGTVGRVLENLEVKIAEDGEILVKGPSVMMGYYNQPEKTDEVLEKDGWFHTGDIGEFEEKEFLKITDRKKEMFKTSGGKYVAPQIMENKFKESRFIEQIMVVGEGEKHPAALIYPGIDFIKEWAARKGYNIGMTADEICQSQIVIDRIQKEVDRINQGFGHWAQVKKIELIKDEMTVDGGELTPTLKLKRKVIKEKYKDLLEKIYRS